MSGEIFTDSSMLEIFRAEVETHVESLTSGLLALERNPGDTSKAATVDWKSFDDEALPLVSEITAVLAGKPVAAADSPMKSAPPPPSLAAVKTAAVETLTVEMATAATTPDNSAEDVTIHFPALIDAAAAENARLEFVAGLDQQRGSIRLDLSKTVDLDATGLAFLAAIPAQIAQGGPVIELSGVGTDLKNLFKATGIDQLYSTGGH